VSVLERIHSSNDIKNLNDEELEPLCAELRDFLIEKVSQTGGHLASNLGAVELTVALHRVYNTAKDRLVFDVGHQCYTHKIITGRRERFDTLRQYGGLSGFPKPYESEDDAFIAGHASNSVSVALGMAKARTLLHEDYDVVAFIGDGALTGGLSYEGLVSAAASGEPMVILLNDNNMSIDPNVGGTASLLQKLRVKPGYMHFKQGYREMFYHMPSLYTFNHRAKEWVKGKLLPENMFSAMGYEYLGPVDGHDVRLMERVLRWARDMKKPVIVHAVTVKGKGCPYAEEHPDRYHGVGPFDPATGEIYGGGESFSDVFGKTLCALADKDERITAVTAAMASGTGLDRFALRFPKRFCDVGIAEGHAAAMISGMAKQGLLPVFAVYSSFLQRAYDMLIHDVSLQKLHVVFGVDRAGLVGSDGETHHGIYDVNFLRSVPGMTVLCPASFAELRAMLEEALYRVEGPVAIRYPRGGEGEYRGCSTEDEQIVREGKDLTIVCYGAMINDVLEAVRKLDELGISAEVIKLNKITYAKFPKVFTSLEKTGRLLMPEEVCAIGCVGRHLLAQASEAGIRPQAARFLNLGDNIVPHGTRAQLLRDFGADADAMLHTAREICGK
jgi:1-deoxy-D-xylulose-5-phosphate synthase